MMSLRFVSVSIIVQVDTHVEKELFTLLELLSSPPVVVWLLLLDLFVIDSFLCSVM